MVEGTASPRDSSEDVQHKSDNMSQRSYGANNERGESPDRESDDEGDDKRKPVPGGGAREQEAPIRSPAPAARPLASVQAQRQSKAYSPAPTGAQQQQQQNQLQRQADKGGNRYFIMKSINHENIGRAVAEGIWATQRHNEVKLNQAFRSCSNVFLIFSVNMSGHFQGYARMTTAVGGAQGRPNGWLGNAAVGTIFGIEWRRVLDLPFSATEHLHNPLNEDKPVRIARDGQELPANLGQDMVTLFEKMAAQKGVARPAPPPRPPGAAAPPRPPPPRPPGSGMNLNGGMAMGMVGMGIGSVPMPLGNPGAVVFNEMGVPVGNLGSFGMGMSGGGGGNFVGGGGGSFAGNGGMMLPGLMGDMQQGGMRAFDMGGMMGQGHQGMGSGLAAGMGLSGGMGPGMMRGGPASMGLGAGMGNMGYSQSGELRRSPPRPREPRGTRSRSHSRSPSRRSRRSRSRGRSRERSKQRSSGNRPNLLQMSYDEYLEHFERVRRQRADSKATHSRPTSSQGGAINSGGMAESGMNTAPGQVMMSEDAYVLHCEEFARQKGIPLNPAQVRNHYRQMRDAMMAK